MVIGLIVPIITLSANTPQAVKISAPNTQKLTATTQIKAINSGSAEKENQPKKYEEYIKLSVDLVHKKYQESKSHIEKITSSHYFQAGKFTIGATLLYLAYKKLNPPPSNIVAMPDIAGQMRNILAGNNEQAEPSKHIFNFLLSRKKFNIWLKESETKTGIQILIGGLLISNQVSDVYQKLLKKIS